MPNAKPHDSDVKKGAEEPGSSAKDDRRNDGMQGQLGHRDQDDLLKDSDTDFPEPGSSPEHSGQQN